MFYLYVVKTLKRGRVINKYVTAKVNEDYPPAFLYGLTIDSDKALQFTSREAAKTWLDKIKVIYPSVELKQAKLVIID